MDKIFESIINYNQMEDYLPEYIEYAINSGVYTDIELNNFCEYYDCKYYELTRKMVKKFKEKSGEISDYNFGKMNLYSF